ncbi:hypothetical protein PoB_002512600 [Plakobranchus ocellatus]|uniref:Uncharacterized protein n=1 Tax=Plakobranchus ocellatus TaxID=259542 RepID=A0AAV3ZVQ8_9GAST|nr:hypothetical protein PoB_002512600 [Plakobranchus ocellatus]
MVGLEPATDRPSADLRASTLTSMLRTPPIRGSTLLTCWDRMENFKMHVAKEGIQCGQISIEYHNVDDDGNGGGDDGDDDHVGPDGRSDIDDDDDDVSV